MRALFAKTDDTNMMRRLDARTKLAVTLTTAILAVACSGVVAQGVLFAATLFYVLLLKRPGLLAVLYGAMAVMMAIAAGCASVIEVFAPGLGGLSVKSLVIPFLRGLSMMNVVMVLAMTTRVEDLLTTLERMRLPFCLFLPAAVMLRFIPTFTNDIRQVWETLKIRGWPMGVGMLTRHPILSSRLLLAPILFRALKSAETLGTASELKGLGTAERTLMPDLRTMTTLDARILSALVLTTAAAVTGEVLFADLFMTNTFMP